ncbi:MAG: glycosyltransferase family 2 protein [Bacteroidota bacterium]
MFDISAVIITKNEEDNIRACLQALNGVVSEILVVDSMSDDDTVAICRTLGAKVIQTQWKGYAQTKNEANGWARHDWILSIDADEVLSQELAQSIRQLQPKINCVYLVDRLNNFCGQWIKHSGWSPDWKPRLFNRQSTYWDGAYVHEELKVPSQDQRIRLKGQLLHYSYRSLEDHWQRMEKYTQLAATAMYQQGKKATWTKLWLSPLFRFIKTYVLKRGFLDGKNGWIISQRNAVLVHMKYKKLRALYQGQV